MTSLNLNYLFKALLPNTVTLELRTLPREFGGNTIRSPAGAIGRWLGGARVGLASKECSLWLQRGGWATAGKPGSCLNDCCCPGVRNAAWIGGMAFGAEEGQPFNELESTGLDVWGGERERQKMAVRFPVWVMGGCRASFMGM